MFDLSNCRADKMVLYNLPICIVVGLSLALGWYVYMLFVQLIRMVLPLQIVDASFLFIPVEACVLSNLYIKWLHEQFDIYFKQKVQKEVGI